MRKVFADSSILIAGAASRTGASRVVLTLAEVGLFQLVISEQVVEECQRNLNKKLPEALPIFQQLIMAINPVIYPDPPTVESAQWTDVIEAKDAPILAAAILAKVDRLLSLNTKDFTSDVAAQCGVVIQTPAQFIEEIREIVVKGLRP